MYLHRHLTAWLWQFLWFRRLALRVARSGIPGLWRLAAYETPLLLGIREFCLRRGEYRHAADIAKLLRANGDL